MDWEGASARRVWILRFFDSDSNWCRFLGKSKEKIHPENHERRDGSGERVREREKGGEDMEEEDVDEEDVDELRGQRTR